MRFQVRLIVVRSIQWPRHDDQDESWLLQGCRKPLLLKFRLWPPVKEVVNIYVLIFMLINSQRNAKKRK